MYSGSGLCTFALGSIGTYSGPGDIQRLWGMYNGSGDIQWFWGISVALGVDSGSGGHTEVLMGIQLLQIIRSGFAGYIVALRDTQWLWGLKGRPREWR